MSTLINSRVKILSKGIAPDFIGRTGTIVKERNTVLYSNRKIYVISLDDPRTRFGNIFTLGTRREQFETIEQ